MTTMRTGRVIALLAGAVMTASACKGGGAGSRESQNQGGSAAPETPASAKVRDRIPAGGVVPPPNALAAKRPAKLDPNAGSNLFAAMNCDGCHGGGAIGWVGPSLVDGRWRYGGTDEEIFTSIFYGRPKGMPAFGGVVGTDGVWMLVSYIKAQAVPPVVPTTSWLAGGNAAATPPQPTPPSPASEEKASPSGAEQAKADSGQAAPAQTASAQAGPAKASGKPEDLPGQFDCTACHAVDHKVVGPAFKDVAAKYRGQDVEDKLVEKVRNGGAGVWGPVPMTPHPQMSDEDLHAVVKYVLSLK
jgi:cytochrome c